MKLEHGFFAMNTPKLIHIPNMANLCHCSTHREWECAVTKVPQNRHIEMKLFSTLEYLLSAFAGVVARVELLPLASLGDFVRGRMGESTRQVNGLFESLLEEAFG